MEAQTNMVMVANERDLRVNRSAVLRKNLDITTSNLGIPLDYRLRSIVVSRFEHLHTLKEMPSMHIYLDYLFIPNPNYKRVAIACELWGGFFNKHFDNRRVKFSREEFAQKLSSAYGEIGLSERIPEYMTLSKISLEVLDTYEMTRNQLESRSEPWIEIGQEENLITLSIH